jgi:hypothetical protein
MDPVPLMLMVKLCVHVMVNGVDFIVQVCHTFRLKNKMHYVKKTDVSSS